MNVETIIGVVVEQVKGRGAENRCVIMRTNGEECGGEPVALLGAGKKKIPICRKCCHQLSSILGTIAEQR